MFTLHDIQQIWEAIKQMDFTGEKAATDMDRYLEFVLVISNAYLAVNDDREAMRVALDDALLQDFGNPIDAEALKQEIITSANYELGLEGTPASVLEIAPAAGVPEPPRPPVVYAPRDHERRLARWIAALRSDDRTSRGLRLIREALKMEGWFDWVPSGPYGLGEALRLGEAPTPLDVIQPRRRLLNPMTEQNDFQQWLIGARANEPDRNSHMNCWEAILFSAFKANLVTLPVLRNYHRNATREARNLFRKEGHHHLVEGPRRSLTLEDLPSANLQMEAIEKYYEMIMQVFRVRDAVPALESNGALLQPKPGDLVFFAGKGHVAISLGRRWFKRFGNWRSEIQVISLANFPPNFTRVEMRFFRNLGPMTFRPCPF